MKELRSAESRWKMVGSVFQVILLREISSLQIWLYYIFHANPLSVSFIIYIVLYSKTRVKSTAAVKITFMNKIREQFVNSSEFTLKICKIVI